MPLHRTARRADRTLRRHRSRAIDAPPRIPSEPSTTSASPRAIATQAADIKGRGRPRVHRQIEARGHRQEIAAEAVGERASGTTTDARSSRALERSCAPRAESPDAAENPRLYRYLMRQGFAAAIWLIRELRRRRRSTDGSRLG